MEFAFGFEAGVFVNLSGPNLDRSRADQNTGATLLEYPMTTAMQGKSRVSSAISICDN